MIDTVVPTALRGVMTTFGIVGVEVERLAAEEAICPGSGEVVVGLFSFLADNCKRVLTTRQISILPRESSEWMMRVD